MPVGNGRSTALGTIINRQVPHILLVPIGGGYFYTSNTVGI